MVRNDSGLHARPCHALVGVALSCSAELRVACGDREVNGKSILELMTLGAAKGTMLHFWAEGPDAEELVTRLVDLVESGFPGSS